MRLFVLLALVTLMLSVGVWAECTDTDDGQDYAVKGAVTYTKDGKLVTQNTDFCKDSGTLLEFFCDPTGKTTSEYYLCECEDGACAGMKPAEEVVEQPEEKVEVTPEKVVEEPKEAVVEAQPEEKVERWGWFSKIISFFSGLFK